MYTLIDFPTKKALREALKAGTEVTLFAPGLGKPVMDGIETIEGPHYPKPHTWYATVEVKDGKVIRVKS